MDYAFRPSLLTRSDAVTRLESFSWNMKVAIMAAQVSSPTDGFLGHSSFANKPDPCVGRCCCSMHYYYVDDPWRSSEVRVYLLSDGLTPCLCLCFVAASVLCSLGVSVPFSSRWTGW
jgi:hypothetical protein